MNKKLILSICLLVFSQLAESAAKKVMLGGLAVAGAVGTYSFNSAPTPVTFRNYIPNSPVYVAPADETVAGRKVGTQKPSSFSFFIIDKNGNRINLRKDEQVKITPQKTPHFGIEYKFDVSLLGNIAALGNSEISNAIEKSKGTKIIPIPTVKRADIIEFSMRDDFVVDVTYKNGNTVIKTVAIKTREKLTIDGHN